MAETDDDPQHIHTMLMLFLDENIPPGSDIYETLISASSAVLTLKDIAKLKHKPGMRYVVEALINKRKCWIGNYTYLKHLIHQATNNEEIADAIDVATEKIENMKRKKNWIVPKFMKQYQMDFLNLFVPTVPFPVCENTLREHHVLMISGAPGSGKTMIAQQLMVKLYDVNKCHPFRVNTPSEYLKKHNPDILQVFHIDDVFGSSNFVRGKYEAWVPIFEIMRTDLQSNNTFIIFTSRDNILNVIDVDNYEVLKHVINLSDQKFKLTNENKVDIFDKHAKASQLDIAYNDIVHHTQVERASDQTTRDPMGYPQRVRLLCALKYVLKETRIRFFPHPMEYVSRIIGSLDQLSYCIIIMLLMNNGKLPVSSLQSYNKSSEQMQKCMDICDLSAFTTKGALRTTANNLCGSFLLLTDDDFFVFQHESIMEAATLDFGKFYPTDILGRCTMQFLLERVFTKDSAPPENVYVVILQSDTYTQLCLRLVKEIQRCVCVEGKASSDKGDPGSLSSLSTYRVFQDPTFLCVFLLHLQDTASFHLLITSSSPDSRHPTFLFFAAASGQDVLIQNILFSYLPDLQRLPGFSDHLVHVLYATCSGGDPATVMKLLMTGARADYMTTREPDQVRRGLGWNEPLTCTTLMHAAYSGNVQVLRLVLNHLQQQQVDVARHIYIRGGYWSRTALHWWAKGGRGAAGALQILMEAQADLHARDKEGRTALHLSAEKGHEASIRALMEAGAYVNVVDNYGQTAIHLSAWWGNEASIRTLMEAGADVNVVDVGGRTALHMSALQDRHATIRALVKAGADVNVGDKDGRTALHLGAGCGHEASIHALMEAGADVNVRDKGDRTALHMSALRGHETSIHALMEAGADVNVRDKGDRTALHMSALRGHEASIRALVEAGADVNVVDKGRRTAHHLSAWQNHEASIRALVEAGANVDMIDEDGRTALHLSAWWGNEASIRALVKARANVNMVGKGDWTALHLSAERGHEASIYALIEAGADVNMVGKVGWTALHLSARHGHEHSIHALVAAGAHVNVVDKDGRTALHHSAEQAHEASIRALLDAGADINVWIKDGRTAHNLNSWWSNEASIRTLVEAEANVKVANKDRLIAHHLSSEQAHEASVRALVDAGADVNVWIMDGRTALHLSARRGDEASIRMLVEAGAEVNVRDKDGRTSLHLSAWRGDEACIRALVEAGADINVGDKDGQTALYWSAMRCDEASICALVGVGADVNVGNKDGQTALHLSAQWGDEASIHVLLEAGADINVRVNDGRTALHYAAACGGPNIVRMLVEAEADVHLGASLSSPYKPYANLTPLEVAFLFGNSAVADYLRRLPSK